MKHAVTFLICGLLCGLALADAPPLVNFQGKLTDASGVPVADGSHSLRFRVYSAATGDAGDPCAGSCLWQEIQSVSTQSGIYSVLLGSVTPLTATVFDGAERYVGVKVGAEAEMTPRRRIASVPYALTTGSGLQAMPTVAECSDRSLLTASCTAICPANTVLTGGGCNVSINDHPNDPISSKSQPVGNAWLCEWAMPSANQALSVTGFAVCH